jgi:hypothetical protein
MEMNWRSDRTGLGREIAKARRKVRYGKQWCKSYIQDIKDVSVNLGIRASSELYADYTLWEVTI